MGTTTSMRAVLGVLFLLLATPLVAQPTHAQEILLGLDLGDLLKVKVTSVQRRESELRATPAPIYVMTAEEIRRSGATTLPDVLRLMQGVHVARANGNTWAISVRGFNSTTANKLLVIIDGRTVYSPLFAGVFWDVQDIPLDSIARIEVIRGPGGSLWGTNAVNGIINIIRKSAAESAGTVVSLTAGDQDRVISEVRHGSNVGPVKATVYGRYREYDEMRRRDGGNNRDDGQFGIGGFRLDGGSDKQEWSVSGDAYSGEFGETRTIFSLTPPSQEEFIDDTTAHGANVSTRLRRQVSRGAVIAHAIYDRSERRIPKFFSEVRDTIEPGLQYELEPIGRHTFNVGADARLTHARIGNSFTLSWEPAAQQTSIYSIFGQDRIQLSKRTWTILGSRFERNDYTGWEFQPNARFGWEPNDQSLVWAGISRSVRTPTQFDRDLRFVAQVSTTPATLEGRGGESFDSEKLVAYEAGYRAQPNQRYFVATSLFFNRYDDLRTLESGDFLIDPLPVPHAVVPFYEENRAWGESFGGELTQRLQVFRWWRAEVQYSHVHVRLHLDEGSTDFVTLRSEGTDPAHHVTFISNWTLPRGFDVSGFVRWVDEIKAQAIGDYTAIDLRLGWIATPSVEAELVGRNIFESSHREFGGAAEVTPSVHAKVSWRLR